MSDHTCSTTDEGRGQVGGEAIPTQAGSGDVLAQLDYKAEVGKRLQSLREAADFTRDDAARVLLCSVDKIGSFERGRTAIPPRDLRDLLDLYQVRGAARAELEDLAGKARKRRPPTAWSAAVPERLRRFFRLEETAHRIRTYNPDLVHGLAQTEAYARALIGGEGVLRPVQVEQLVDARMARQARLTGPTPVRLTIALPEVAVRSGVGGPDVMRGQVRHLIDLSESGRADIRVIPYGAMYRGRSFPFTILDVAGRAKPLAYLENMLDGVVVEHDVSVGEFEDAFDHIIEVVALSPADTVRLLATVAEEL